MERWMEWGQGTLARYQDRWGESPHEIGAAVFDPNYATPSPSQAAPPDAESSPEVRSNCTRFRSKAIAPVAASKSSSSTCPCSKRIRLTLNPKPACYTPPFPPQSYGSPLFPHPPPP